MKRFISPGRLRRLGILGMNARNASYIAQHNPRRLYPLVDDKLQTKRLAIRAGIAVPELYARIGTEHEARRLAELLQGHGDFVVKPAHGSGGNGILVITGSRNGYFQRTDGDLVAIDYIRHHISNILSGMYSLGGLPDQAMIEYRVRFDPLFDAISYRGVPDIRTLVYQGVPVMAMVRLPTRKSGGRANLHQGAVGAGVDIATGATTFGVWRGISVDRHPDTDQPVTAVVIPAWRELLVLAARCQELTGLGYLGVDVVLDRDLGPLVLELNARPGLNIQIANRVGLLKRLERVDALGRLPDSAGGRAELARELFGTGTTSESEWAPVMLRANPDG